MEAFSDQAQTGIVMIRAAVLFFPYTGNFWPDKVDPLPGEQSR